jgi:hypothetical protein
VTQEPGSGPAETARQAAERNAQAVMNGNLTQVMADITPEALAQMMQMGAQAQAAGLQTPQTLPSIQSYTLETVSESAEEGVFKVTFHSQAGTATLSTRWVPVMGHWKIAGVELVSAQVEPGFLEG